MIDNRLVGRKISALRQGCSLTQQQLAVMMNVSHQAVSKWESGQALPDIQTMLQLTRFFGITVEQLVSEVEMIENNPQECIDEQKASPQPKENEQIPVTEPKEAKHMTIQQLLQMAPFMSKEMVEEIALGIETGITAAQLARIAPYMRCECVEKLIDKHKPELTWDSLRRIAPYMSREYVDNLARSIADGKETVKPAGENISKTINDIGKAFDDIGKGVEKAVRKAWRIGETVINEVSGAINDLSAETDNAGEARVRSERAAALRKRAFERALTDGKWDWIGAHISELDGDPQLLGRISSAAREAGMNEWICKYMGNYADENTIEAAIQNGNWDWLSENACRMDAAMHEKIALAAADAQNWEWLKNNCVNINMTGCALELAMAALRADEEMIAVQIAINSMIQQDFGELARVAIDCEKWEALAKLALLMDEEEREEISVDLAEKRAWAQVRMLAEHSDAETVEKLMEIAVEQGDFDAIDMLDSYL